MFKNMRLAILFYMFLNASFKMTTNFVNVARTTASTSKFIYYETFRIIRNWVFIWKILISNKVKLTQCSDFLHKTLSKVLKVFYKWGICIFNSIRFNVFYVIMKRIPILTNFKRLIKHLIKLFSNETDLNI